MGVTVLVPFFVSALSSVAAVDDRASDSRARDHDT